MMAAPLLSGGKFDGRSFSPSSPTARLLIGIEAFAGYQWARELIKLGPPGSADAAELCEALRQAAEERCRRCGGGL
jgi:hypothetical protein